MKQFNRCASAIHAGSLLVLAASLATAADLHVPADHATIQAAVDAASDGATIRIASGIYVEQVRIYDKSLTLVGVPGSILRAFPNMDPDPMGNTSFRAILLASGYGASNVVVRGLTFEGDQLAAQQQRGLIGAYYLDAGGAVDGCRFTGFREQVPGGTEANAVRCLNDLPGAPLRSLRIADNVIEDSYVGIVVVGAPGQASYEFSIEHNRIRGVGPNPLDEAHGLRGIDLGNGIRGVVESNTVSDFAYNGEGAANPFAWGIIAVGNGSPPGNYPLDPIRFEDNDLRDNNLHMVLLKAHHHEILNNRFSGTGPTHRMAGLWFTGSNVVVRANEFTGMDTGIRVGGEDLEMPGIGMDYGVAEDAELQDNRFCEVATPIEVQSPATAVENGTLTCPWSEPMEILLAWPMYQGGYALETARNGAGPWTSADESPQVLDGYYRVGIPANAEHQFFRLRR